MVKERADQEAELAKLLTRSQPVGPASADELSSRTAAKALYDSANDIDSTLRSTAPVFLIGRRGSGKTAVLKGTYPEGELDVNLNAATMILEVALTIEALQLPASSSFAELVPPVWRAAFVAALCARVHSDYCKLTKEKCPISFRFGQLSTPISNAGAGTDMAAAFLGAARNQLQGRVTGNVEQALDEVTFNGVPLWQAKRELLAAAEAEGCKAIVSVDSLDQYEGMLYTTGYQMNREAQALQGLYRAASETGRNPNSVYKVRVSFPAELWHFYNVLSSNPMKDFDNCIVLHWDGTELLKLVGRRLLSYLRLRHPEEYRRLSTRESTGSGDRWPQLLLLRYLPGQVVNGMGQPEPTIAYLLRHTQLLPRNLVFLVNRVLRDQDLYQGSVSEEHVRTSVNDAADTIADTVADAYRLPYPNMTDACESIIPHLPLRFSLGELQKAINRTGYRGEADGVIRMFIEAGVLGRVLSEDAKYIKADFEYLYQSKLYIVDEDELCLHPAFASRFKCLATKYPAHEANVRAVLPFGSEPERDHVRRDIHLTRSLH